MRGGGVQRRGTMSEEYRRGNNEGRVQRREQ